MFHDYILGKVIRLLEAEGYSSIRFDDLSSGPHFFVMFQGALQWIRFSFHNDANENPISDYLITDDELKKKIKKIESIEV